MAKSFNVSNAIFNVINLLKYGMYQHRFVFASYLVLLIAVLTPVDGYAACQSDRVDIQVMGSGGPEMSDRRASSSYLLSLDGKALVLIDAGPGSSLNFEKSGADLAALKAIVFTHFHVDHSGDFPALIKASFFTDRNQELLVFGPAGNQLMPSATEFVQLLFGKKGVYRYLNNYINSSLPSAYKIHTKNVSLQGREIRNVYQAKQFSLAAVPVHHGPIAAVSWRVDVAGCSLAFSGDLSNRYKTLAKLAKNADILVAHNAIPESAQGVARVLHMQPSEIGRIAAAAKVKKLLLAHRMQRTLGKEKDTLEYIRQAYSGPVVFVDDLDVIKPD
jgi:ribonuclease BN (tRNA processing enzyme)